MQPVDPPESGSESRLVEIIPAIDLRNGRCVRLQQGDFDRETVFDDDPVAVARRWAECGAPRLHLVDLDGAKAGRPMNGDAVAAIVQAVAVPCQLGGGLRTTGDVEAALELGVTRVVVGTQALRSPQWFADLCQRWPDRVLLGLDARGGCVAVDGWQGTSTVTAIELLQRCDMLPLAGVVYTDIGRDGMLAGPNFAALAELVPQTRLPVIASGGVASIGDVDRLCRMPLAGVIIGRALYEGKVDLRAALDCARQRLVSAGDSPGPEKANS